MTAPVESAPTLRQQIEANIQHVRNQQIAAVLQKQQAESEIARLSATIEQAGGAIAAYEATLALLPADPVLPGAAPANEPAAPTAEPKPEG